MSIQIHALGYRIYAFLSTYQLFHVIIIGIRKPLSHFHMSFQIPCSFAASSFRNHTCIDMQFSCHTPSKLHGSLPCHIETMFLGHVQLCSRSMFFPTLSFAIRYLNHVPHAIMFFQTHPLICTMLSTLSIINTSSIS